MANMRSIRTRIKSVKNTQQITKAMKMVAVSKLRRAQSAMQTMTPFAETYDAELAKRRYAHFFRPRHTAQCVCPNIAELRGVGKLTCSAAVKNYEKYSFGFHCFPLNL